MATEQLYEFNLNWKRHFPSKNPPSLNIIDQLRRNSVNNEDLPAIESDILNLNSRKTELEDELDQVQFCLSWLNERKESIQADDIEESQENTGEDESHFKDDIGEEENYENLQRIRNSCRRSCSLISTPFGTPPKLLPRRGSDGVFRNNQGQDNCTDLTRADLLRKLHTSQEPKYENGKLHVFL